MATAVPYSLMRALEFGCHRVVNAPLSVKESRRLFGTRSKPQQTPVESSDRQQKTEIRTNKVKIQMLSSYLRTQIFGSLDNEKQTELTNIKEIIDHLKCHGLWDKDDGAALPDANFKLPELLGSNLDEHFRTIALQQSQPYADLVKELAASVLPAAPTSWNYECGWTKYNPDGSWEKVDFPAERALVFDVEVLVTESQMPTLATAVSSVSWYSWCSKYLVESQVTVDQKTFSSDLIPMETKFGQTKPPNGHWEPRLIVGHNVSYDRARIKEQYYVKGTLLRFLDTMSLHIASSGLTGLQRALLMADRTGRKRKEVEEAKSKYMYRGPPPKDWMKISCLNNLADVYQLYCKGPQLKKEERDIFVKGSMTDVKENFQPLMSYCSRDVKATKEILSALLPIFLKRCPHPVTLAGMLEMGSSYLPVNKNWDIYLENSQTAHDDLDQELKHLLMRLANDACEHLHDDRYKLDPWLWNLDWSVKERKTKSIPQPKKRKRKEVEPLDGPTAASDCLEQEVGPKELDESLEDTILVKNLLDSAKHLYVRKPNVAGYPSWYCDLCPKFANTDPNWKPGPILISTQMQITPRLLRLTWDGYPLHFSKKNGWGYLVPGKPLSHIIDEFKDFPLSVVETIAPFSKTKKSSESLSPNGVNLDSIWEQIMDGVADPAEESRFWNAVMSENDEKKNSKNTQIIDVGPDHHHGNGPYLDEDVPGCWFFRLPHKDGPSNRVGNPLAKDFLNKIEDGTLFSIAGEHADWALKMNKKTSYWRNAHKRIMSQLVVWLKKSEHPKCVLRSEKFDENEQYGAIIPLIVTAGTVTRRAVEATWLTASNAYVDRVGSELKAMIQSFPGYHFVGADVDSQELWIAALLGDCHFSGIHGSTALGWMTLQGKKSNGTDMHSKTAAAVGISRDQAKVMNYGRIYGAGQQFASRLLIQFNHRLTLDEAKSRAQSMYASTKGVRGYILNDVGEQLLAKDKKINNGQSKLATAASLQPKNTILSRKEVNRMLRNSESRLDIQDVIQKTVWIGGTESAMFNKLEEIAMSPEPETPVLKVKISRSLEPAYVMDNFMTSRVNWVVQSSAVDYLHLMLVAMRWLFDSYSIDGRFCISIHDEVRYLVKSEDRYRAALALQITNLLTRAMFAHALGMKDLPQCVAFFSSVDIDTVLRKEVHLDCKTPSNVHGLENGYGIPQGEAMDIYAILEITKGSLLKK